MTEEEKLKIFLIIIGFILSYYYISSKKYIPYEEFK